VIALVHLVRHANGLAPFERFLESYARHDAGQEHELVLVYKGFPTPDSLASVRALAPAGTAELAIDDSGRDLRAFMAAARAFDHERLCFLNSYATIEAPGWLAHLSGALDLPGAGLAGATGSWGSHRSFALNLLGLPNAYRGLLGDRALVAEAFAPTGPAVAVPPLRRVLNAALNIPREIAGYDGFPAPHIRTNAFLIERSKLLSLRTGGLRGRTASYRFEGGRRGLTGQLLARGERALVVGRDGTARDHADWPDGETFWQGDQRDLLVADNQTRVYESGPPSRRQALAHFAWGERARVG
jgi:hypothetical protein